MQEQDRLPMLVEMGRVPAYPAPVYNPAGQEPEEGKLPLAISVDSQTLPVAYRRVHCSGGDRDRDRFVEADPDL